MLPASAALSKVLASHEHPFPCRYLSSDEKEARGARREERREGRGRGERGEGRGERERYREGDREVL